jgi:hypothetical protein
MSITEQRIARVNKIEEILSRYKSSSEESIVKEIKELIAVPYVVET